MCHHAMQNHGFQVCGSNMPFQSGCKVRIQVVINSPYCHQLFVLQCLSRHMAQFCWTNRVASRCSDSHDSTMNGCAAWTSITVVFKFPRKAWGATCLCKQWIPGTPLWFFKLLGTRLLCECHHFGYQYSALFFTNLMWALWPWIHTYGRPI